MMAKLAHSEIIENNSLEKLKLEKERELLHHVVHERVRQTKLNANQAHWSFSVAIVMTTASALIGLVGAGLVLLDKTSEGSVTAAVGLASSVYSYQLSKEAGERQKQANNRLDQMLAELQQTKAN
ncbi:MAG: hypothetical protein AAF528_00790 [Cyanobacteria bacterium P01_C01_bin.121]